jgi:hypothetical protein
MRSIWPMVALLMPAARAMVFAGLDAAGVVVGVPGGSPAAGVLAAVATPCAFVAGGGLGRRGSALVRAAMMSRLRRPACRAGSRDAAAAELVIDHPQQHVFQRLEAVVLDRLKGRSYLLQIS